jgi:hypothetical protein
LYAGFESIVVSPISPFGDVDVTAKKPNWTAGSAAPISFKPRTGTNAPVNVVSTATASQPQPTKKWTLSASDIVDEDDDLLLREQDKVTVAPKPAADCGTDAGGSKKACKDCSCGLAQEQAGDTTVQKSACGSVCLCFLFV